MSDSSGSPPPRDDLPRDDQPRDGQPSRSQPLDERSSAGQPRERQSYALGETDTPPARVVEQPKRRGRGSAHLNSVVLSLLLTPVALVALDYSLEQGWGRGVLLRADEQASTRALIAMGVAAAVLLVVAALSRLSGLGPLLAGLVWGVLPSVAFALRPFTTAKRVTDLPDLYDQFLIPVVSTSSIFPVVAGLLVGVGLFGRWRGTRPAPVVEDTGPAPHGA